jgi:hypothetical protein
MNRSNILFCLADDAGLHFGAYGCRWVRTPAFDRVAREGLLFQRGYTPNAKYAPSRAAILTGRSLTDIFANRPQVTRDHVLLGKQLHDCGRPNNQVYAIRGIIEGGWLYLWNFHRDRLRARLEKRTARTSRPAFFRPRRRLQAAPAVSPAAAKR